MAEQRDESLRFDEELAHLALAQPFIPFDIVTSSGERYEVTSPLELAVGENAVVVLLPKTGVQILRKTQITALHVREPAR